MRHRCTQWTQSQGREKYTQSTRHKGVPKKNREQLIQRLNTHLRIASLHYGKAWKLVLESQKLKTWNELKFLSCDWIIRRLCYWTGANKAISFEVILEKEKDGVRQTAFSLFRLSSLIFTIVHFEPTTKGIVTHLAFTALTQNINWFSDQMFAS